MYVNNGKQYIFLEFYISPLLSASLSFKNLFFSCSRLNFLFSNPFIFFLLVLESGGFILTVFTSLEKSFDSFFTRFMALLFVLTDPTEFSKSWALWNGFTRVPDWVGYLLEKLEDNRGFFSICVICALIALISLLFRAAFIFFSLSKSSSYSSLGQKNTKRKLSKGNLKWPFWFYKTPL